METETKKRILIVEDHTILREGLKMLIASDPLLEVAGEAQDGLEGVRMAEKLKPDLVLLDLSMPRMSGMTAIREIKRASPNTQVLVLTVHKTEEYIFASLKAGADGYVLKDATHGELKDAIRSVLEGRRYLSPVVSGIVIEGYLDSRKGDKPSSPLDTLTNREREILKLIAEGHKNKAIAHQLCISSKTVEKHRANLMRKLNLHSVSAVTSFAMEKGLLSSGN